MKRLFISTALFASLIAPAAHAQTTTFGQYHVTQSGPVYKFTNNGANSGLVTVTTSIPVTFSFNVPNTYGAANDSILATLQISEVVSAPAVELSGGGFSYDFQAVKQVFTMITANTPVNGLTNLLTLGNGSTGTITGATNGATAAQSGDTTLTGNTFSGNVVNFTSDFLSFAGSTQRNYTVGFTSVTPGYSINGNGYLNSFTAQGDGSFASDVAAAPEPSGLLSLAVMGGGLALCLARRRTQTA